MEKSKIAAIVILNWNGEGDTVRCIKSIIENDVTSQENIIVVDNGSRDNSIKFIQDAFPKITYILNDINRGFTGGVNQGIELSIKNGYEFTALLNNDALVTRGWLDELICTAKSDKDIAIVASKILKIDKKTIDTTGDTYSLWGVAHPRGRDDLDGGQYEEAVEIFAASGGACLIRHELIEEIGYFDEDFFAYYEDVDFSFRARLNGWKVVYCPKSVAFHKVGASSNKVTGFGDKQALRNLPWIFIKNVPFALQVRMLPRFAVAYLYMVASTLRKKAGLATVIKGVGQSILGAPKMCIKRFKQNKLIKVKARDISKMMSREKPVFIQKWIKRQ